MSSVYKLNSKKLNNKTKNSLTAVAFAPASIGNVGVGFDALGLSVPCLGDIVSVQRQELISNKKTGAKNKPIHNIKIQSITGVVTDLPKDYRKNTATAAIAALLRAWGHDCSLSVSIKKNIPLGSGLGGSAASAVAGVMAVNKLLGFPFAKEQLFQFALEGERVASGAAHPDNVAPCLFGGLVLASSQFSNPVIELALPKGIFGVVVHPEIEVKTKEARQILKSDISLTDYVKQSALLSGFVLGCLRNDHRLLKDTLKDLIIEPQRAHLIPDFLKIKNKVLQNKNCIGFSISGSGPSVFAWVKGLQEAQQVAQLIQKHFTQIRKESQSYVFKLSPQGARNL